MSDEEIAKLFLAHLEKKGRKLCYSQNRWSFESGQPVQPDGLEHILRTFMLASDIKQNAAKVKNIFMILRVTLDPNPLGKPRWPCQYFCVS